MRRRTALQIGASTLAACHLNIVPSHVLGGAAGQAPSDTLNLAVIGAGGRARQVLRGMLSEPDVRVVAVADPAESFSLQDFYYRDVGGRKPTQELIEAHYQKAGKASSCAVYSDFEEMLSDRSDIDAVICGTPDHLHAYVTAKCLAAGKHVYCEKPLTHNIWEARTIARLAKESGLATQMGNQGHSTDGIRRTCELIWAGAIGDVQEVKAWVSGHRWNPTLTGKPSQAEAVPDGLEWDRWLGPRAQRPFHSAYFPVAWRDFWAFGNSNIGDFACHDLDAACWALDLRDPTTIDFAPAGPCNEEIGPHGCVGYYEFPANDKRGPVNVTWYDGGLKPAVPSSWPTGKSFPSRGILFLGSEGTLFCPGAGGEPEVLESKNPVRPEASLPRVQSHARDWLDAIHAGGTAGSHFGYGANLTEIALLGAMSLRVGKKIHWDAANAEARNAPETKQIFKEKYRDGWSLDA